LTDVVLQLAEGERVLMRSHKAISAADVLALALRIAGENQDQTTLTRLARAADVMHDQSLVGRIKSVQEATKKLSGNSRTLATSLKVSVERLTPANLCLFQDCLNVIQKARIWGDRKVLNDLDQAVATSTIFSDDERSLLKRQIADTISSLPVEAQPDMDALRRLSAVSRAHDDEWAELIVRIILEILLREALHPDYGQGGAVGGGTAGGGGGNIDGGEMEGDGTGGGMDGGSTDGGGEGTMLPKAMVPRAAIARAATVNPNASRSVAGQWNSNYGPVSLQQNGHRVTGTVRLPDRHVGQLDGTYNGGILVLNYRHPIDRTTVGRVGLMVLPGNRNMRGTYRNAVTGRVGPWNMWR
jgi:hypothetical protein